MKYLEDLVKALESGRYNVAPEKLRGPPNLEIMTYYEEAPNGDYIVYDKKTNKEVGRLRKIVFEDIGVVMSKITFDETKVREHLASLTWKDHLRSWYVNKLLVPYLRAKTAVKIWLRR